MMDIIRLSIVLILLHILFLFSTQNYFFMFTFGMNTICKQSERRALLSFKQRLKDPDNSLSSWSGENCCRWVGVHCHNTTDHVIHLHLHDLGLSGELNPSLQELKQLRHLDLSSNHFDGIRIPDFLGSLQNLRYLNLSRANFNGMIPHQLGHLSNLRYLDLSSELIDGGLIVGNLEWISHLFSLKHLDLSGNIKNASSNWFHVVNMLPSLLVLRLSYCGLSGALPSFSHVNFTSLAVLDLRMNSFNSTLPEWLYSLTNLQQLDLGGNGFQGTISASIGNLTKLTLLDLSYNDQLDGEIPITIGNLCKLQKLDLSENQFEGEIPTTLGNLCKLQSLDLSANNLIGKISGFLGSSIGCIADCLEPLELSYNPLSGPIPLSIGRLINLKSLLLEGNSFSSSIPLSIGRLSLLEELDLSDNKLNGSLPESLGNLSKLVRLDITKNAFGEGVVVSEVHFANMTNLQYLSMDSLVLKISSHAGWVPPFQLFSVNLKNCRLGLGFPMWLRTQKNLTFLKLSNAGISGTIPTWFWNFTTTNDFIFDLSHNELHGELPKVINASAINLRSNQFAGQLPRVTPNVRELDLSNNSFSVPISTFLCNPISGINYLEFLDLSNNRLSGDLSDCWVYWKALVSLRLGRNEITGNIPSSMGGSLLNLEVLHLSKNNLSGELPSSLRNCTSLFSIDLGENRLTGRLPIWLGQSFQRLHYLRLRSNKFSNEIPLELCHLVSLQVLDIAHNYLRGSIPRCFNNFSAIATMKTPNLILAVVSYFPDEYFEETTSLVMKGMELKYGYINIRYVTSLDLSTNSFSGEIPEDITSLIGLRFLNLSENHFIGKIPEKIGNMVSLESLDLSNNNLSGVIPQSISGISFLSHLNVSYNNLSGKIPSSTQLQSFNESCYIGNQELCGPPLVKKCNGEEPPQKSGDIGDREVEEDEVWFEMKWFYISMGVGFAVGFWAFWGVIILKGSWRIAYFRFLDDMKDKLFLLFSLQSLSMMSFA